MDVDSIIKNPIHDHPYRCERVKDAKIERVKDE